MPAEYDEFTYPPLLTPNPASSSTWVAPSRVIPLTDGTEIVTPLTTVASGAVKSVSGSWSSIAFIASPQIGPA